MVVWLDYHIVATYITVLEVQGTGATALQIVTPSHHIRFGLAVYKAPESRRLGQSLLCQIINFRTEILSTTLSHLNKKLKCQESYRGLGFRV